MTPDSLIPVAAAGVGALVGSMYLDSRFLVSRELHQIKCGFIAELSARVRAFRDISHYYYGFKYRANATPNQTFILFEGKSYTYRQVEKESNQLAHWLLAQDVKPKDVVCMMHQNHPTFFITLLAISKIGALPSLINTNLASDSLLHCVSISKAKLFVFDPIYEPQVMTIMTKVSPDIAFYAYGEATITTETMDHTACPSLTQNVLQEYPTHATEEKYLKGITQHDGAFLIFTSGTTGLPKAAVVQHIRVNMACDMFRTMTSIKKEDRAYCVLPLYHSSGLIVCCLSAMQGGGTIVLGRKFSARRFWNDCVDYKVTVICYIGEICRYLQSQPTHPEERNHQIRLIYGNGLRPDVWTRFRDRFAIPQICEFYASTEGPSSMLNLNTNQLGAGAVGFRGYICRALRGDIKLIKVDPIMEEPFRSKKNGYCVECSFDEQGELVTPVQASKYLQFDGYYGNKEATNKKILRNVFKKGDIYFRTGDLLRLDSDGFFYFEDRMGDTFRWKSENVATTEVARVVGLYPGVSEVNVYGALVPHHDGRVGVAAISLEQGKQLDFKDFYQYLHQRLPKYAVPVFIRIVPAMEITGTFKVQKTEYRNQGIDLTKVPLEQPMYWISGATYVPFCMDDLKSIQDGVAKL